MFKLGNISVSEKEEIIKPLIDTLIFNPRATNKLLAIGTEILFVKKSNRFSYVFTVGYGQLNIKDSSNTYRDTIKIFSSNIINRKEFKIGAGMLQENSLKNSPLSFLTSAKIFSINYFDRRNISVTKFSTFNNELLLSGKRDLISPSEIDLGVELGLSAIYLVRKKVSIGIEISHSFFFTFRNGDSVDKTNILDTRTQTETERTINRKERQTSFNDRTNFSLIFSYSFD